MSKSWQIPRRTFLKGMGASILLPMLDIMEPSEAAVSAASPRFVAIFNSLGTYGLGYDPTKNDSTRYNTTNPWDPGGMGVWFPSNTGALTAPLPPALAPLESLKQKITLVSGLGTLVGDNLDNSINHSCAVTSWMTSAWNSNAQATSINVAADGSKTVANNTPPDSLDQYIANYLGITPGSSLVLSPTGYDYSEPQMGGHGGYISYNSQLANGGSTIVPKVLDPMKAFNSLFGNCNPNTQKANLTQKSVLDYVMNSIPSLQKKLSSADSARLDSYLQNIRDLEVKIMAAAQTCPNPPTQDPAFSGGALDWVTTVHLMADVIALAVSSGTMPVASMMTDSEANGDANYSARVSYLSNYVGIGGNKVTYSSSTLDTHFDITHQEGGNNVQTIEEHIAYTQMNISISQRLIQTLNSMPVEPNGFSPLDNTIILVGACHNQPGYHGTHNLPTLLAGGKKYGLNQGQHLRFPMVTDIGDLYYSIIKAMGVSGSSFNGHSNVLSGVFG